LAFAIGLLIDPVAYAKVKTLAPLMVESIANLFRALIGGAK
jgi:hypothetical protein